jgi:hypothetical protein
MTTLRTMICLALVACAPAGAPARSQDAGTARSQDAGTARSPEQTADLLSRASHGFTPLSGIEVLEMLEEAKRSPGIFVPLLSVHLRAASITRASEPNIADLQAGNSVAVLAQLGEQGRAALASAWRELQAALDEEERALGERAKVLGPGRHPELEARRAKADRLIGVQLAIVYGLASAGDARLRDDLLARFDQDDFTRQTWSIEYFENTAKGDPKVKEKLRPYFESPGSRHHGSPRLRAILEAPTSVDGGKQP